MMKIKDSPVLSLNKPLDILVQKHPAICLTAKPYSAAKNNTTTAITTTTITATATQSPPNPLPASVTSKTFRF